MIDRTKTMYTPNYEHDACGMGFITQVDGQASHQLVERADDARRMNHRGGTGAELDTGDGAGILLSMPDASSRPMLRKRGSKTSPRRVITPSQCSLSPKKPTKSRRMLKSVNGEIPAGPVTRS